MSERKEKNIKIFLITKNEAKAIEIENDLETFRRLLGCRCIDIQERFINGYIFDFVVDDEARLSSDYIISGWCNDADENIAGPLIICGCGATDGEEHGLDDEELKAIAENLIHISQFDQSQKSIIKRLCENMAVYQAREPERIKNLWRIKQPTFTH